MKEMLTFSAELTADASERTISGKIVPFNGEVGNTSAGAVVFERGAINIADSSKVKLLLEHDPKQPIGRAQFFNETEDGIYASFKISKSSRGTDALIEASEELRTGLSVGVMVNAAKPKNGVLYVSSADRMQIGYHSTGTNTSNPGLSKVHIFSYGGSTNKTVLCETAGDNNGSGDVSRYVGLWRSTAAVTSVTFDVGGTINFKTGSTFTLYGIKAA